jgi:hypothetical protein
MSESQFVNLMLANQRFRLPNARAMQLDLGKGSSLQKQHNWAMTAPALFAQTVRAFIEGTALPNVLSPL